MTPTENSKDLFAEWRRLRAVELSPEFSKMDDVTADRHSLDVWANAHMFWSAPANSPAEILQKIEILEDTLYADGSGTAWDDNREMVMVAAIKADLVKLFRA